MAKVEVQGIASYKYELLKFNFYSFKRVNKLKREKYNESIIISGKFICKLLKYKSSMNINFKKKFYIATSLKRIKEHNILRDALLNKDWKITYDWTLHGSVKKTSYEKLKDVGLKMIKGVFDSDVIIVLLPGGKGTHTELGMAIAKNKNIIIHAVSSKYFSLCDDTIAFYHRENILQLTCPLIEIIDVLEDKF